MSNFHQETVLDVRFWTDRLFSFRTSRSPSFRYESGMFTMIGLPVEGRPLVRAYSIASPAYSDELEFLSIVVENGPLTSRLRHIKEGDEILVGGKPTGTLLLGNLLPGRNLYLLATGTGLAAYLGLIRDPEVYQRFERVILVHGVRHVAELAFREFLQDELQNDPLVGEEAATQFLYVPTVTREPFIREGRITTLLTNNGLETSLGLPPIDRENDRFMICGGQEMLHELSEFLETRGFQEGSNAAPGDFVVEKAFAQKPAPRAA